MRSFFAIGMPRCRSLWLSHLFSFGDSYCLHEYLSGTFDRDSLPEIQGMRSVGSCDTYPPGFDKHLVGDSPLLVIHRPLDEVKKALVKSLGLEQTPDTDQILELMYDRLLAIRSPNQLSIQFEDLNKRHKVKEVVEFMGIEVPDIHINKLMTAKIALVPRNRIADSHHQGIPMGIW